MSYGNLLNVIVLGSACQSIQQLFTMLSSSMSRDMRKPDFCICENKDTDQLRGNKDTDHLRGNAKLISAFVFATQIEQSLYFLNTKFQAASHLMRLYSQVSVGPGRKSRRPVFSQRGSYNLCFYISEISSIMQVTVADQAGLHLTWP